LLSSLQEGCYIPKTGINGRKATVYARFWFFFPAPGCRVAQGGVEAKNLSRPLRPILSHSIKNHRLLISVGEV
jgi:hypothetical protein